MDLIVSSSKVLGLLLEMILWLLLVIFSKLAGYLKR